MHLNPVKRRFETLFKRTLFSICLMLGACVTGIPQNEYQRRVQGVQIVDKLPDDKVCIVISLVSLNAQSLDLFGAIERLKYEVASRNGNTLIVESETQQRSPNSWKVQGRGYGCDF